MFIRLRPYKPMCGTLNILEACRKTGSQLVHASSSEVYGSALRVPIDEEHPLQGQSPYSASKIGADKLVEAYFRFLMFRRSRSDRLIPTARPEHPGSDSNHHHPGNSIRRIRLGNLEAIRDFTLSMTPSKVFLRQHVRTFGMDRSITLAAGRRSALEVPLI